MSNKARKRIIQDKNFNIQTKKSAQSQRKNMFLSTQNGSDEKTFFGGHNIRDFESEKRS